MAAGQVDPSAAETAVRYTLCGFPESWLVSEADVPVAAWHEQVLAYLRDVLRFHVVSVGRDAAVFRNLAVRVRRERPSVGFDPDLCFVEPAPPEAESLDSLCLWRPGHSVPRLTVEVVSPGHPHKDYVDIPARCASVGVQELIVFDPKLAGPASLGGPFLLQVWCRGSDGAFERVTAGSGPGWSQVLGAWLVPGEGGALRVAEDPEGARLWLTELESERTEKEHERTEKEEAFRRIAVLEAELRKTQ
jgi:hypothetical protein